MILVVSSHAEWGALLCAVMRSREESCNWRSSARAGIERIRSHPVEEPLLVLLDNDLGDSSGFDVVREVRSLPLIAHAALILCGSDLDTQTRQEATELGVVDFLVRGEDANFTVNRLFDQIIRWYRSAMAETAIQAAAISAAGMPASQCKIIMHSEVCSES
jgi:DNA-binding response OmpR family regulator